jgi:coatomer subunit beta'
MHLGGDGEYIIYTSLAWRNKAFGSALDFVWASKENSNDFAIRESPTSVKVYKNFVEKSGGLDVGFQADGLSGGTLLGVAGQGGVSFFDWQTGGLVRRIEVEPKNVYWSESGELVAIACEDTFYVLRFSREAYVAAVQAGEVEEDGVEAAFEVITDISERYVSSGTNRLSRKLICSASGRASGSAPFSFTPTAQTG